MTWDWKMSRIGRARERSETQGFMKILIDAETKKILGAAILGIGGDEIVHSILDVMYADSPYTVIQRAVHIHPTVTELVPTMLGDLRPLDIKYDNGRHRSIRLTTKRNVRLLASRGICQFAVVNSETMRATSWGASSGL